MILRPALRLLVAALAASAAASGSLLAETVRVRSGEHGSFTRIVAEAGARGGWMLGRAGSGYELRLGNTAGYDLGDAFRLIGRERVATLSAGAMPGSLVIGIGCTCHARAFETPEGALVIDVADGPPPPGSSFEGNLPATFAPRPVSVPPASAETTPPAATAGSGAPSVTGDKAEPGRGESAAGFAAAATTDPGLAVFWRGVRMPGGTAPPPDAEAPQSFAQTAVTRSPPQVTTPPVADPGSVAAPQGHNALPRDTDSPPPVPAIAPETLPSPVRGDGAASAEGGATGADLDAAANATTTELPVAALARPPDTRVTVAQTELLRQLGRAASQGLVDLGTEPRRAATPAATRPEPTTTVVDPQAESTDLAPDAFAVHAETSIDRDALLAVTRPPVTADGDTCLPDAVFDITAWGDERPLAVQIADWRAALVGEFDRPSPDAVIALARLYLHFGFGAESRAVLAAFDVQPEDGATLADMGRILDGESPGIDTAFSGMTGCDTAAALWAVMAWPRLPPATDVEEGAVVRAFSGLPAQLRRLVGPGLVERLVSAGATGAAQSVRGAIARVPDDGGHAIDMVEARLDFASGDADAGERRLDALARTNAPLSAEALILTLHSRLNRGEAVAPALADSAEALAFEQQDGPDGPVLASLHILSRASTGEFVRAFAAFRNWPGHPSDALRADTSARLFAMLVAKADERTFLTLHFGHRDLFDSAAPDLLLRLDLGERLASAGFAGELRRVLKGEAAYTERGRRLLARAALGDADPDRALAQISGLGDPEAEGIRAEALALRGDHAAAAATFSALGEDGRAALEAWRGGDVRIAAATGPEPLRAALGALGRGAPAGQATGMADGGSGAPAAAAGSVETARRLVEESRAARAAVEALVAATPIAHPVAPAVPGGS